MPHLPNCPPGSSLRVEISREPFDDYFKLTLPSGHTEELLPDDTREWFKERGADPYKLEKVLDEVWNFYSGAVTISNYREPALKNPRFQPQV